MRYADPLVRTSSLLVHSVSRYGGVWLTTLSLLDIVVLSVALIWRSNQNLLVWLFVLNGGSKTVISKFPG